MLSEAPPVGERQTFIEGKILACGEANLGWCNAGMQFNASQCVERWSKQACASTQLRSRSKNLVSQRVKKLPFIAEVSDFTGIDTGNVLALFGSQ